MMSDHIRVFQRYSGEKYIPCRNQVECKSRFKGKQIEEKKGRLSMIDLSVVVLQKNKIKIFKKGLLPSHY
jgi:hypothetical protein